MADKSYWPDFGDDDHPSWVRRELDAAGNELKDKTRGRILLQIEPFQSDPPDDPFGYDCQLVVPSNGFVFLLFRVTTNETGTVAALEAGWKSYPVLADVTSFRDALKEVLHTERTQQIVQNLLSMAA